MRLYELLSERNIGDSIKGPAWVNIKTKKVVPVHHYYSHNFEVYRKPEVFGIKRRDLLDDPKTKDLAQKVLNLGKEYEEISDLVDGDEGTINFMGDRGWFRVIHNDPRDYGSSTNIQARSVREIHAIARMILDIEELYGDAGDDHFYLTDKDLKLFLKTGRISPKNKF